MRLIVIYSIIFEFIKNTFMPDFVKGQMVLIKSQNTQRASTEGSALTAQNALWIIEISWLIDRYGNRHFDRYGARSEKLG